MSILVIKYNDPIINGKTLPNCLQKEAPFRMIPHLLDVTITKHNDYTKWAGAEIEDAPGMVRRSCAM